MQYSRCLHHALCFSTQRPFVGFEIYVAIVSIDDPSSLDISQWGALPEHTTAHHFFAVLVNKCDLPVDQHKVSQMDVLKLCWKLSAHHFYTFAKGDRPARPDAVPILDAISACVSAKASLFQLSSSMRTKSNAALWTAISTRRLRIVVETQAGATTSLATYEPFKMLVEKHVQNSLGGKPTEIETTVDGQPFQLQFSTLNKSQYVADGDAGIMFMDLRPAGLKKVRSRGITFSIGVGRRLFFVVLKEGDFPAPNLTDPDPDMGGRTPLEFLENIATTCNATIVHVSKEDLPTVLPSLVRKIFKRTWQITRDMVEFYRRNRVSLADPGSGPIAPDSLRNLSWAYDNRSFSDVRLDVVEGESTRSIFAHKSILFSRSSTFRSLFSNDPAIQVLTIIGSSCCYLAGLDCCCGKTDDFLRKMLPLIFSAALFKFCTVDHLVSAKLI